MMLSLYQKDVRDQRGLQTSRGGAQKSELADTGSNLTIGFLVMKVRDNYKCFKVPT